MIALTSLWIWIFYASATQISDEPPTESDVNSFYAGAQTLKWFMYTANLIPLVLFTWDIWATQSSSQNRNFWWSNWWSNWNNNDDSSYSSNSGSSSTTSRKMWWRVAVAGSKWILWCVEVLYFVTFEEMFEQWFG